MGDELFPALDGEGAFLFGGIRAEVEAVADGARELVNGLFTLLKAFGLEGADEPFDSALMLGAGPPPLPEVGGGAEVDAGEFLEGPGGGFSHPSVHVAGPFYKGFNAAFVFGGDDGFGGQGTAQGVPNVEGVLNKEEGMGPLAEGFEVGQGGAGG